MRVIGQIFLPAYGAKDAKSPFNAPFLLSEIRNHPFTSGFDREIIAEAQRLVNSAATKMMSLGARALKVTGRCGIITLTDHTLRGGGGLPIVPDNSMNKRLAVLIDADNVPRGTLGGIMQEVAIYGTPTIKRIYGDWTGPYIAGWKNSLLENAVTPIQQYSYTTGKNSTDSAMIIDAMDILYTEKVEGFVLVSSDSDFTRLAIRLREAGMTVFGIGERKTPEPFRAACDKFIYIENINKPDETVQQEEPHQVKDRRTKYADKPDNRIPKSLVRLIAQSVADLSEGEDAVYMGELGNLIMKKKPDFDCRNYGFKSLSALIKSIDRFEVDFRQTADPNVKHPYVRDKEA